MAHMNDGCICCYSALALWEEPSILQVEWLTPMDTTLEVTTKKNPTLLTTSTNVFDLDPSKRSYGEFGGIGALIMLGCTASFGLKVLGII